jgi:hypothetical protein
MNSVQQIISGIPPFVYGVLGLFVAMVLILFIRKVEYDLEHQYVGFGYKTRWVRNNESDGLGNVYILARLIDSPAGRAGIPNRCWLLEIDDVSYQDISAKQFLDRRLNSDFQIRQKYRIKVKIGTAVKEMILLPELIQGPIPCRVVGHGPMPNMHGNESDFEMGMTAHFEPRTGLITLCPWARPSDNALSRIID